MLVVGLPEGSFSVDAPISRDPHHAFARRTVLPATHSDGAPASTGADSISRERGANPLAHPPPAAAAAAAAATAALRGPPPGATSSPLWPASVLAKKNAPKPAQTSFSVLARDELSG